MEQPENKLKWLFLCGLLAWVGTYTKEGSRTCRLVGIMLRERERERERERFYVSLIVESAT